MYKRKEASNYQPRPGQVKFRLLCNTAAVGGLIGHSGAIIKSLEKETSTKISVDVTVPAAKFRLIHVIGPYSFGRSLVLGGRAFKVSPAQEALVRVFERMLEVEAEAEAEGGGGAVRDFVTCCLVVAQGMVGAVMGRGGERINKIIRQHGGYVKILPLESPLPGSDPSDEFVQITGATLAVKKTLAVVSRYLQQKAIDIERGAPDATSSRFKYSSMELQTNIAPRNDTANGGDRAQVFFKLICPCRTAGFVIGFKGGKVKSLEEETKASIRFSAADDDYLERVVTISAFENREVQYSFAQNATVRVFNELVKTEEIDAVTARLLILPYQSDWLNDGEISTISAVTEASGATLKILELDNLPVGASADEKVLQIDGDYPNVQIALFQVTWRLRERFFNTSLPIDNLPLLPHKILNSSSQGNEISALTDNMNKCSVSNERNGSRPPVSPHSQLSAGSRLTRGTGLSCDLATASGGSNIGSGNKSAIVTKTTLEIVVREDLFGAVYGENDNNLTRLRLISGATVEVHDPSSGSDGKVIISGTRDQTLVAQSLLKAFLMSSQQT